MELNLKFETDEREREDWGVDCWNLELIRGDSNFSAPFEKVTRNSGAFLLLSIYIYIYKTEAFAGTTIFHVSII